MSVWQPISTAPKSDQTKARYILIGDGICVPDLVTWRPTRPARITAPGAHYMARPEGWFDVHGLRSRLDGKATVWTSIPDYD